MIHDNKRRLIIKDRTSFFVGGCTSAGAIKKLVPKLLKVPPEYPLFSLKQFVDKCNRLSKNTHKRLKYEDISYLKYLLRSPSNALPCLASSLAIS